MCSSSLTNCRLFLVGVCATLFAASLLLNRHLFLPSTTAAAGGGSLEDAFHSLKKHAANILGGVISLEAVDAEGNAAIADNHTSGDGGTVMDPRLAEAAAQTTAKTTQSSKVPRLQRRTQDVEW